MLMLLTLFCGVMIAQTQTPLPPESGTGLEGVISVSPIQGGPSRMGVPDSRPLANTAFVVKKENRIVTSFNTDDQGRFRIYLPSGHYAISMKDWKGAVGYYGPFEVDIAAGQIKTVQWKCDTGMR
jgi:hypothetical protein